LVGKVGLQEASYHILDETHELGELIRVQPDERVCMLRKEEWRNSESEMVEEAERGTEEERREGDVPGGSALGLRWLHCSRLWLWKIWRWRHPARQKFTI
jgi:hypothetical protein